MADTWEDVKPQPGKQTLAWNTDVDFMLFGGSRGSAKSYFLNMRPLEYIDDPHFRAIMFRRQYGELIGDGGLWQTGEEIYPLFGGEPNLTNLRWKFPSGASIRFSHMFTERDKESHRGLQYSFVGFDEINQFSKTQVTFLLTCLRSKAKVNSFCIGTLNPDPDSWCLELVEWYLDDAGFPREDRCGKIRYFVVVDGDFVFGDSEEYFQENYPDSVNVTIPTTGEKVYIPPKKFAFINATVFDNPKLLELNPNYLSELQNLPDHERDRQLWGNWYARPKSSNLFERDFLDEVDRVPRGVKSCRAWDKAHSEISEVNKYPDFTAGSPKLSKCRDGYYYIEWEFHPDIRDDAMEDGVTGKFRKRPGERDQLILKQAKHDGEEVHVIISVDPSGKDAYEATKKKLLEEGFVVYPDPMPSNKSKLVKFEPFASACQDGLVRVVKSSFPNKATYNAFMKELEAFDGERSTSVRKDDWPDSIASAFNYLSRKRVHNVVVRNQNSTDTYAKEVLENFNK